MGRLPRYELKAQCGGERAHRSTEPDATMVFADRAVVLDHLHGTTYLLALAEDGDTDAARTWLADTARRITALAGRTPPRRPPRSHCVTCGCGTTGPRYLRLIEECQEEIAAGETYEVCLTNMAEADGDLDPWDAYRTLRRVSPAPFGALLAFGGTAY
ncbi:chorismate-binding protein [Streptomyces endophytica]|uniref:Chorismate-binding protein n=1 Tax=Streptomyces endophytica TaxID=2991496 RepID=A0ABY6P6T3_9ACTN|nr:chorismate-binding protein [Streptomyces endophytica]UZJ29486.1 chorismate-binding protein [Streptomyces endophytica]